MGRIQYGTKGDMAYNIMRLNLTEFASCFAELLISMHCLQAHSSTLDKISYVTDKFSQETLSAQSGIVHRWFDGLPAQGIDCLGCFKGLED